MEVHLVAPVVLQNKLSFMVFVTTFEPCMCQLYEHFPSLYSCSFFHQAYISYGFEKLRWFLYILFLGIHFEVDMLKVLQPFISLALRSFFHAVDTMLHKRGQDNEVKTGFNFSLNCQGIDSNHRWKDGPEFYRSVSKIEDQTKACSLLRSAR